MNDLTFYVIAVSGALIALYAALPFIIKPKFKQMHGVNGSNGLFKIHINHNAPHKYAVVAHEWAEWQYKYRRPWLWTRFRGKDGSREVNLWGPAVETAYAVRASGVDERSFIQQEARNIKGSHTKRKFFGSDWTEERIAAEITSRMPEAREWVDDHWKKIKENSK